MLGIIPSPRDDRDHPSTRYIAMGARPSEFTPPILTTAVTQHFNDCFPQTLALMKTYQEYRERGVIQEYSTQFIYQNRKDGQYKGPGMIPREALNNLVTDGVPLKSALTVESEYSEFYTITDAIRELAKPQIISKYASCSNYDEACNCMWANGPVATAIPVYESFMHFTGKILPIPDPANEKFYGYHGIPEIYYVSDGSDVQNSWGETWGNKGHAIMPPDYPVIERWITFDQVDEWDKVELWIGQKKYRRNGVEGELDVEPIIINSRTMVPLRFISEALGADVQWDGTEKKITIVRMR